MRATMMAFPPAPVSPLEEVYYALALLQEGIDTSKLTLLLGHRALRLGQQRPAAHPLSAEELGELMASGEQHYSTRYACAYLTGSGQDGSELVAWYLDQEAIQTRKNLAQAFDVGQLCLIRLERRGKRAFCGFGMKTARIHTILSSILE